MRWWALVAITGCGFSVPGGSDMPTDAPIDTNLDRVDAAIDARTFDAGADCPGPYTLTIAGHNARYRLILGGANFKSQHAACAADRDGYTHLVALDDMPEVAAVQNWVTTTSGLDEGCAYVGFVQRQNQTSVGAGWLQVTGAPLTTPWDPGEPNDAGNGTVENNQENVTFLGSGRTSQIDVGHNATFGAVCECDGKAIAPEVTAIVSAL